MNVLPPGLVCGTVEAAQDTNHRLAVDIVIMSSEAVSPHMQTSAINGMLMSVS